MKATASSGRIGSLKLRNTNDAQLPSGIRAAAAIKPRVSRHRSATFTVLVAINNLPPGRSAATAREVGYLNVVVGSAIFKKKVNAVITRAILNGDCPRLLNLEYAIDTAPKGHNSLLDALRPETEQSSPPEEVFDHVMVILGCGDPN